MAGFLAFEHCDDADAATRPAALVTAALDAIRFGRGAEPSLARDLTLGGRVVWTGATSLDVEMELRAAGGGGGAGAPPPPHARALFTFAARDALTGAAHRVRPLEPRSPEERARFAERGAVAAARRAERAAAAAAAAGDGRARGPPGAAAWAAARLAEAAARRALPALLPAALLSPETALENVFTAQPQERNLSGRIFGGYLMRRAYELADSAAHLFSAARPRALAAGEATFARPVEVSSAASLSCQAKQKTANQPTHQSLTDNYRNEKCRSATCCASAPRCSTRALRRARPGAGASTCASPRR